MYEPNVDDYNWIGLSHDQSEIVEKSLECFLNLRGKWLEVEIEKYAKPQNVVQKYSLFNYLNPNYMFYLY